MDWLVVLTYLASALLCLYLFILIAVFAAICFGLAKLLGWGNRKLDWALDKANSGLRTADRYATIGMDKVAQPEIRATAAGTAAETFLRRLFARRP